jgi:hypothetical protein
MTAFADFAGFAESTLQATEWLMVFHPERLPAWLERHPRLREDKSLGLEQAARAAIEQRRGMTVEQWRKVVGAV